MASIALAFSTFPAINLILILLSFSQHVHASNINGTPHGKNLITEVCKASNNYTDLCIASLMSNPVSYNATRRGLVHISVKQVIANVSAIRLHISKLQSKTHDPIKEESFRACYEDYTVALRELRLAFKHFKARNYGLVLENLMMVETVARDCEMEFKVGHRVKRKHVSLPLTNMNLVATRLARVAFALLSNMIRKRA